MFGISNSAQIILDPDYLPDYLSIFLNKRLPKSLFHLPAKKFYDNYFIKKQNIEDKHQFLNNWIKGWEQQYGVS